MKEFIEKLIGRLEELTDGELCDLVSPEVCKKYKNCEECYKNLATEFVNELAKEYKGGWIPCSKELPPQPKENPIFENKPLELYLVSEKYADYPLRAFWNGKFFTDGWGKLDVLAWQPLPQPYQQKEQ